MTLSQEVDKFIEKESLFTKKDRLLVAVSGGMDSMVLAQLLYNQGYSLGLAHVNFKLRGEDSDLDQLLVEQFSQENNIPLHVYELKASERKNLKESNLQEKARQLRYSWFGEMADINGYDHICTAHHKSDQIETFFLNLIRGSGINGLSGMKSKYGKVKRPLLKISKLRIEEYAQQNSIPYRDDLTNFENDYDRNFIRNEIINRITNNIPRASVGMSNTINILSNEVDLFKSLLNKETNQWVNKISAEIKIGPLSQLVQINGHHSLLFHILNPYDYNNSDINDILQDIHTNGRQFNSHQYSAEIRNDYLLLNEKHSPITSQIEIKSFGNWQNEKGMLTITSTNQVIKSESHNEEYIEANHLKFPLFLRNAEKDDWFCPIGMKGKSKKLTDFFKDQKLSSFQKKSSQVLCDQEKIIWVIGLRLDDRSKIEPNTTLVCKLEWRPS